MLAWPNSDTDWAANLSDATACYKNIAETIARRQPLLVVCQRIEEVKAEIDKNLWPAIRFYDLPINDTWIRDYGPITVLAEEKLRLLDFQFNGWGGKFPADLDNFVTQKLWYRDAFSDEVQYKEMPEFILEGGSIETDGQGTILTTSMCLLSPTRNETYERWEVEAVLNESLGAKRILWLEHGHLHGDDTDGHIDTLARFCDTSTIAYVQCTDQSDLHYDGLSRMEEELRRFTTAEGKPYRLVPLPLPQAIYGDDGRRLPATYANFLIINDAVLLPLYEVPEDEKAKEIVQELFPGREVIGINCRALIEQHGSLHCITMQLPEGILKNTQQ